MTPAILQLAAPFNVRVEVVDYLPWNHSYARYTPDSQPEKIVIGEAPTTRDILPAYGFPETLTDGQREMVALHELGHVADNAKGELDVFRYGFDPEYKVRAEVRAWEWAIKHTPRQLTADDWHVMRVALRSYGIDNPEAIGPEYRTLMARIESELWPT